MTDQMQPMTDQIERELVLPAPPEQVWEVITGPGWLADDVHFQLVPGGEAHFSSEDSLKRGWVEEAVPPGTESEDEGRLTFWWAADQDPATRVELTLTREADGATRLRVVESRPLEVLDVTGIPLPGAGGSSYGPAMVAVG